MLSSKTKELLNRSGYYQDGNYPLRRNDACDICKKNVPTEFFAGFLHNSLWICHRCYNKITENVERKHSYNIIFGRNYWLTHKFK